MKEYEPNDNHVNDLNNGVNDDYLLEMPSTSTNWAVKAEAIYSSLQTMEEKLAFLIRYAEIREFRNMNQLNAVGNAEQQMSEALEREFMSTYIDGGTEADHAAVFTALARLATRSNEDILNEYDRQLQTMPQEDPNREKKAYYLAQNTRNGVRSTAVNYYMQIISSRYSDSPQVQQRLSEQIRLNERITMGQLAGFMGYEGEQVQGFLNEMHANANTPALAFYTNLLGQRHQDNSRDNVLRYIREGIKQGRLKNWKEKAKAEYLRERGYSEARKQRFDDIARKNTQDMDTSGINDWIKEEGKAKRDASDQAAQNAAMFAFHKSYIAIEGDRENARTSAERIRRPTAESYSWIVNPEILPNGRKKPVIPTQDQRSKLNIDTHLDLTEETARWLERQAGVFSNPEYLRRIGNVMINTRNNTVSSWFTIWALGTHDDINITNCTDLHENPELVEEFARYCEAHPTIGAQDEQTYRQSAKAWSEICLKAKDKISEFTLPAVDYSDPVKIKKTYRELAKINLLCVDFLQEKNRLFENRLGIDGIQTASENLGGNKWNETVDAWAGLQNLLLGVNFGYMARPNTGNSESLYTGLVRSAAGRMIMDDILEKHAGKHVGDILQEERHNLRPMANVMALIGELYDVDNNWNSKYARFTEPTRKDVIEFLNGRDKRAFRKKFTPLLKQVQKEKKAEIENDCNRAFGFDFLGQMDLRYMKDRILSVPENDPQAVQSFLLDSEKLQVENRLTATKGCYVSNTINRLFTDAYRCMLTAAGVRNRMDAFLIDGKTPGELWGKKYKAVTDPGLKERCLQFEVLKKIVAGDTEVRAKVISYDRNNRLTVSGSRLAAPTVEMAKRLKYNLTLYKHGMEDMISRLEAVKQRLLTTHPGFQNTPEGIERAKEEIGSIGSGTFKEFESSLSECIRIMRDTRDSRPQDIRKAMERLSKASTHYYNTRKPLYGSKSDEQGQTRLDMSENVSNHFPDYINRFLTLRNGITADIDCGAAHIMKDAPSGHIEAKVKGFAHRQYGGHFRQDEVDLSQQEKKDIYKKYSEFSRTMQRGMEQIGKDMTVLMDLPNKPDPYDAAISYYMKKALDRTLNGKYTAAELDQKRTELDGLIRYGGFQRKAGALSRNPVFREFIRQNGNLDYQEWKAIEDASERYVRQLKAEKQKVDGPGRDVVKYVLTGNAESHGLGLDSGKADIKDRRYRRLGDYIAKQILTDPKNEMVINAICSGRMKYDDVVRSVVTDLKRQNLFDGGTVDAEALREKISTGRLKDQVTENITKKTATKAKVRSRVLAGQRQAAPRNPLQGPAPGHH